MEIATSRCSENYEALDSCKWTKESITTNEIPRIAYSDMIRPYLFQGHEEKRVLLSLSPCWAKEHDCLYLKHSKKYSITLACQSYGVHVATR
jgi:hypothetical protein